MNIIPKPNNDIRQAEGIWKAKPNLNVQYGSFSEYCLEAFSQRINARCMPSQSGADIVLFKESSFRIEEYELDISTERVTVRASTDAGVILALTTLYACIGNGGVSCFSLRDAPKYTHRALMLDCVRHFFNITEIKKIIEQIALVKMNKLHWHLSDDQGWRIESKAYPALHEGIPYYTKDEIKDIVSFAKKRNVEVIPEIDMPGHMASAVHVFPWLSCAGKQIKRPASGGIYKAILCAGKDSTYDFVFKILDEVVDLFESPFLHIGGDEAPKIEWKACPACAKKLAEIGTGNFEDLQGYFTFRVAEYLSSKGKKPVFWNETLKAGKQEDGLTIQYWMPGINDGQVLRFFNKGQPVIFSNMFYLYLDYPHAVTPLRRVFEYEPAIGGNPCGDTTGTHGLEACLWAERVDSEEKLEKQLFPRIFALAENAWSRQKDYSDFKVRLAQYTGHLQKSGIAYTLLADADMEGEARMKELKSFSSLFAPGEPDDNRIDPSIMFGGEGADTKDFAMTFIAGFGIDPSIFAGAEKK